MTSIGSAGFTVFTQHAGDKKVYVNSSRPDNSGDGLSDATAKKTIAAGLALLTNNSSDWLLLKQGQTWTDEAFGTIALNGRSKDEPLVIGSYDPNNSTVVNYPSGLARPKVQTAAAAGAAIAANTSAGNYIAIVGIEFYCYDRDPGNGAFNGTARDTDNFSCISWMGQTLDTLFEDLKISYYVSGVIAQAPSTFKQASLRFRRNVIVDQYGGHSNGVYLDGFEYASFSEDVFDKNGYNETIGGAYTQGLNTFNHGLYVNGIANNTDYSNGPVDMYGVIYGRDVTGPHFRSGAHLDNLLMFANTSNGDFGRPRSGVGNYIINTVILQNLDQKANAITISGIATDGTFTYSAGTVANSQVIRLAGTLPAAYSQSKIYDVSSRTATTFKLAEHGSSVITSTSAGGACTGYDVGTSTDGQVIYVFRVYPQSAGWNFDEGAVQIKNNVFAHYEGPATAGYIPFTVKGASDNTKANYTVSGNVSYKWAGIASDAGRTTLFPDDAGLGTFSSNIQDTNGDGTDDNTSQSITQYTTTAANLAKIETYASSVLGISGTQDAFMNLHRNRLPGQWTYAHSAVAVNDWVRGKFGMQAINLNKIPHSIKFRLH